METSTIYLNPEQNSWQKGASLAGHYLRLVLTPYTICSLLFRADSFSQWVCCDIQLQVIDCSVKVSEIICSERDGNKARFTQKATDFENSFESERQLVFDIKITHQEENTFSSR